MTADYAYRKWWQYERDHGQLRTTPAGPTVDHIAGLLAAGWTTRGIADAAAVSATTVNNIACSRHARTSRTTAARILAVTPDTIRTRPNQTGFVLKHGAVRRIQALMAIGHRHADITAAMRGHGTHTHSQIVVHQAGQLVERRTHDAVAAAYNQLSMTPGPSRATMARARAAGYLPPLAWDDHLIDDPDHTPAAPEAGDGALDEIAVDRIADGTLRVAPFTRSPEHVEAIRRLAARGLTDTQIAARIGMSAGAVTRTRLRKEIPSGVASGGTA